MARVESSYVNDGGAEAVGVDEVMTLSLEWGDIMVVTALVVKLENPNPTTSDKKCMKRKFNE